MFRQILCVVCLVISSIVLPSIVQAQVGGGTNPVPAIDPDCGSVLSTASANPESNINCWISRSSDRAVAIYVYEENNQLKANFRQYQFDGESYASTKTKIMNGTTQLVDTAVISVKLISVASTKYPLLYKMVYTSNLSGTATDHEIGYLNFVRGNKKRASSKVSISLTDTVTAIKVIPSAGDPCGEPVIDDIGEEEDIAKSPTIPNAPTNFVLPIAACSTGGGAAGGD